MFLGGFGVFEVFEVFRVFFFNFPLEVVCEVNFKGFNNFKDVLDVPQSGVRSLLEIKFGIRYLLCTFCVLCVLCVLSPGFPNVYVHKVHKVHMSPPPLCPKFMSGGT